MDKNEKIIIPSHLQEGADVEAEGELTGRLVGRSREGRDEGAVETTEARLCFVGVHRGLSDEPKKKEPRKREGEDRRQ